MTEIPSKSHFPREKPFARTKWYAKLITPSNNKLREKHGQNQAEKDKPRGSPATSPENSALKTQKKSAPTAKQGTTSRYRRI